MAITGRQLRGLRFVKYRLRAISDDVGVRQGYLFGSALHFFVKPYTLLEYKDLLGSQARHP